jgi:hypothetical protein
MRPMLTDELARALDAQGGAPLCAVHPVTGKVFVVVSEESYSRLKPLFEPEPLSIEEKQFQLQQAGQRAGWDDPKMDAYDNYDEHRPQSSS